MKEVLTRRYGEANGESGRTMENLAQPDLILIDGGLGQLAAALEGLKAVGQQGIPILGLAKARGDKEERVFLAGRKNSIALKPQSPSTHLLQRIRDEAHRCAITFIGSCAAKRWSVPHSIKSSESARYDAIDC